MIIVDTSAWIEYFRDERVRPIAEKVDRCLDCELVGIGDLIYCEVMQGIPTERERSKISALLDTLPHFDMVGFEIAARAAANFRLLRSKGITVRKTIDVVIGTFCAANQLSLVHDDRDFELMAPHIGLNLL